MQRRKHGSLILGVVLIAAVASVGGVTLWVSHQESARAIREVEELATDSEHNPGAMALMAPSLSQEHWETAPIPAFDVAGVDGTVVAKAGCIPSSRTDHLDVCEDQDGRVGQGQELGSKRIVLAGGSHDTQYFETLQIIADAQGWELITVGRDGCRLSEPDPNHELTEGCMTWNAAAIPKIIVLAPDAVFTLSTVTDKECPERTYQGQMDAWQELGDAGIPVVGLRDNPRFGYSVPECLQTTADYDSCGTGRASVYAGDFAEVLAGAPSNLIPIDTSSWFCVEQRCPAIIGNVVVYKDHGHFTATYARTLAPLLLERLEEQADFLFN